MYLCICHLFVCTVEEQPVAPVAQEIGRVSSSDDGQEISLNSYQDNGRSEGLQHQREVRTCDHQSKHQPSSHLQSYQ